MGSHTSRFEWIYFYLQYEIFLVLHNWGLIFTGQIYYFLSISFKLWGLIFAAQIYYFFPSFLGCQQMCYVSVKWVHILSDLYKFLFTITTPFVLALSIAIDDLNLESTLNYLSTLQYFEN